MDIKREYKMQLLGMMTAIGYEASAQPKHKTGGWIPCSERLPKWEEHTEDMVLACFENGCIRFNGCSEGQWLYGHPTAWMPLPEPYKEEKHE